MQLTCEAPVFVRWRKKAGHFEGDAWVKDDGPRERTGEYGKYHLAAGPVETVCGRQVPAASGELAARAPVAGMCHSCLKEAMRPYLG